MCAFLHINPTGGTTHLVPVESVLGHNKVTAEAN